MKGKKAPFKEGLAHVYARVQVHVYVYRGEVIYYVKGSVCFVLKFALTPFSPSLPSGVKFSIQNMH